ncbi:hypothetical protein [Streptomyces sp. NPDC018693]|uniref:hypothetical protein n=1 Tax=unclassified Streptomyces TaxID=2593676 RepID=UPI0037A4879D
MIDWLEQAADLPHLIARVSELVLRLGHAPEDLVVLPRAELDRRELAAYSAGWADVVAEQLPAIRRAYEERITVAYLQGQEDARTGRRPRRARRGEGQRGGEVIPLPYVELLRPPAEVTRVEERGERERSVADGGPVPPPGDGGEGDDDPEYGRDAQTGAEPASGSTADILLSAREVREKRAAPSERRPVLRRNGRPSVPPLALPGETGAGAGRDRGRRTESAEQRSPRDPTEPAAPGPRGEERPRLSDKARALADELEGRAGVRRRDDEQPGGH